MADRPLLDSLLPDNDTIAAIATAPGRGGVGIVRVSGAQAQRIGEQLSGIRLRPRHAHFTAYHGADGSFLDRGITLFFPCPQSFTGEDVAELQAHGGPVIMDLLLRECLALGARQARPGEFSERAFLNDKLDLAQAEGIADLINSSTEHAARNASRSLQGVFSDKITELVTLVTQLRVYVEAAIDFPEEEIDFLAEGQVGARLEAVIAQLDTVLAQARQGRIIQEGMKLVIAGAPNAGKSSLLNALAGVDRAIVTPVAGTTRDVLREQIQIDGMPLHIVDTAGLHEAVDEVEQEGIRRAHQEIASADRILWVVDGATQTDGGEGFDRSYRGTLVLQDDIPVTIVRNKCDLSLRLPGITKEGESTVIELSAKTGEGMDLLLKHLKTCMGYVAGEAGGFSARRRHLTALQQAAAFLQSGREQLAGSAAGELLAEDLRGCQNCLGEITGKFTSDALLGEIFSSFCIGK